MRTLPLFVSTMLSSCAAPAADLAHPATLTLDGARRVSAGAVDVTAGSRDLADEAARQATELQRSSASLQQVALATRRNAEGADAARRTTAALRGETETGRVAMERLNEAISRIRAASDETARIVRTIDEIAFQTNLLALNAAVEAARAGEAGKGFAVVAEEVRNLAQRSAEAAKNTAQMIEESVKNADNGVAITREVGAALAEISSAASEVNQLVAGIAQASNEQNEGNQQINTAVGQMDHITQANAANAEQTASASEELSGHAEELSSMVRELESMVGGENAGLSIPARMPAKPMRQATQAPPKAKAASAATRKQAPARAKKIDHVIAFDEDELELVGSGRDMIDV